MAAYGEIEGAWPHGGLSALRNAQPVIPNASLPNSSSSSLPPFLLLPLSPNRPVSPPLSSFLSEMPDNDGGPRSSCTFIAECASFRETVLLPSHKTKYKRKRERERDFVKLDDYVKKYVARCR